MRWTAHSAALLLCAMALGASAEELSPRAVAGAGDRVPTLRVEPSPIILGRTSEVSLEIQVAEEPGEPPLRGSVNVGRLGAMEPVEPGLYRAIYRPPNERFPQVAVIALWRETGPDATVSFFRIPLFGTASIPVETSPGARVTVNLQGRLFGPYDAGADGKAVARLVVPPGVTQATVSALTEDGSATSQTLELGVPPYNRLTVALVPHTVTADGVSPVRLHIYFDDTGRRPPPATALRIATSLAPTRPVEHVEGPLYLAEYTAPPGTADGEAVFRASLRRDSASRGRASVNVGRQQLSTLSFDTSSHTRVADGESEVELRILARDELGLGIAGLTFEAGATPAALVASQELVEVGGGEYLFRMVPVRLDSTRRPQVVKVAIGAEGITAEATVELAPWVPAELRVETGPTRLSADGTSETALLVRAVDAEGRPMDHLPPSVRASAGSIIAVTAAEQGGYLVAYRAPLWKTRRSKSDPTAAPEIRAETIRIEVGGQVTEVAVELVATTVERWRPRLFAEVGAGFQTNLGALAGPMLVARGGTRLMELGPAEVSLALWTGLSMPSGSFGLAGSPERVAKARLFTVPALLEVQAELPFMDWVLGAGAGGGVMFAPGTVTLPGAAPVPVGSVLPAFGLRLAAQRGFGPGRLSVGLEYLFARRSDYRGVVDVTGRVGGLGMTLGYGVEL